MIRRFEIRDAQEVSDLIAKTMRTTNIKDYSSEYVENDIKALTPEYQGIEISNMFLARI